MSLVSKSVQLAHSSLRHLALVGLQASLPYASSCSGASSPHEAPSKSKVAQKASPDLLRKQPRKHETKAEMAAVTQGSTSTGMLVHPIAVLAATICAHPITGQVPEEIGAITSISSRVSSSCNVRVMPLDRTRTLRNKSVSCKPPYPTTRKQADTLLNSQEGLKRTFTELRAELTFGDPPILSPESSALLDSPGLGPVRLLRALLNCQRNLTRVGREGGKISRAKMLRFSMGLTSKQHTPLLLITHV